MCRFESGPGHFFYWGSAPNPCEPLCDSQVSLTPVCFADSPFLGHTDSGFAYVGRLRRFDFFEISLTLHRAAEAAC